MDAFMGSYELRLDAKGRVSVPAQFRALLRDGAADGAVSLVLRPSHNLKCIEAWPVKRFHALTGALNNKAMFSPEYTALATSIFARAVTVESDREGRIVIPERLAKRVGITNAVSFMGMGPHFAVWEPELAERHLDEADAKMCEHEFSLPPGAFQ